MEEAIDALNMLEAPRQKVVGMKQVMKGLAEGSVNTVFLASDADVFVVNAIDDAAKEKGAAIYYVPSKSELGRRAGIQVDAACVGVIGK